MKQYLKDTKFAANSLIETIHKEEEEFSDLSGQYDKLKEIYDHLYWDFSSADLHEDFNDVQVQHKFVTLAKFAKKNDLKGKKKKLDIFSNSINTKRDSINSLSMSLLQIAKQGISKTFGRPSHCPNGRNLGSENLIIWQGRNRAIHCEEGEPNQSVIDCFLNLENDFGDDFNLSNKITQSRAKSIINLLEWNSYEKYEADMISLIG